MKKKLPNILSVIVPTYKQEKTIEDDIVRIKSVLDQIRYDYEIIVIIDGEEDNTAKNVRKVRSPKINIIQYKENKGKGYAVRLGMAKAKGNIVAFIDAGMDLHPNGLSMLLEHFEWYNADIIVGSKLHPVSKIQYPLGRRVLSLGYRWLVRLLFGLSIKDTQVGMKFFKREVLVDVLPRLRTDRYAFDIEMLAVAHHLGHTRIYEAPVELNFTGMSSITSRGFWKVIYDMLVETLIIFYRLKVLKIYDVKTGKNS
jgi:glycosyltransferase involved in cell wall biosynthesis